MLLRRLAVSKRLDVRVPQPPPARSPARQVGATALLEGLGGRVEDAKASEILVRLTVGEDVKEAEEVPADSR